ncbi:MAG TPA: hypothetical protein VN740_04855 [Solirubrobacteraceae bacterium]|nr:hypothetical protein [Solirubrobacteraceae bacterium]
MLDLRLYRVTLLPFAILVAIAAFSLHTRPSALTSPPVAQGFSGSEAVNNAATLAEDFPSSAPGSPGDDALADNVARGLAPCVRQQKVCTVRIVSSSVATTAGTRTIRTVIASRAGSGPGVVLIADRGGAQRSSPGSLAATEILLQLAGLYTNVNLNHPLTLVSTSGGASAIAAVAAALPSDTEAAVVIGDVAHAGAGPYVVPWSSTGALAPVALRRSVEAAIAPALSRSPVDVSLADQLGRLALPLTTGAQGLLERAGIPAVALGSDGEAATPSGQGAADPAVVGAFGQALLALTRALDQGPALATAPTRDLAFGTQVLGGWAARAVIGALLLSLLGCALDVFARARRRRAAVGIWLAWVLSCAAPFLLAAIFVAFLGAGGLLPAAPAAAVTPAQLPIGAAGAAALVSVALLFVLAWVLHAVVRGRSRYRGVPEPVGAAAALLLAGTAVAALLWIANPYTAALLVVPMHLWLVVLTREHGRRPLLGAVFLLISLAPLIAATAIVCAALHVEPLALAWTLMMLIAGGGISAYAILLSSLAAGVFVAAAALLLRTRTPAADERVEVTVRGPLSYAGPGSLGGTPSALRR